jgi:transcription elongation GreA/GreB family factor
MKVSEFRIDIVYDPQIAGVPKIAIECDGAKYHSSREAYLHDRHRQKILEAHGFVFHRIWSTNWWRNPQRETQRLVDFISSVESRNDYNFIDHSGISLAFTDEILKADNHSTQNSAIVTNKETTTNQSTILNDVKNSELLQGTVRLGSVVCVKYLNINKLIKVHLVETAALNVIFNGIQEISARSPLATSILGHVVGDIVKVGDLDNFVEIIEVNN